MAFIWQRYFFPHAKHERECRKCRAERNSPVRSYLVLAPKLVDCPEMNRERENRREELVGSAARPVQLTIKRSPKTLIHREARRRVREKEGGEREAEGEREAQLTNRPISRDDEVLRLIPSSQKPLRELYSLMTEYQAPSAASRLHRVRRIDGSF